MEIIYDERRFFMSSRLRTLAALGVSALLLSVPSAAADAHPYRFPALYESSGSLSQRPDSKTELSAIQIVDMVNRIRTEAGLAPLTQDDALTRAAAVRAAERPVSHTRPNGTSCFTALLECGVLYRGAGENIAWGQTSAEEAMNAWMASPGHRANILHERFQKIGVACYQAGGTTYYVQLFTY